MGNGVHGKGGFLADEPPLGLSVEEAPGGEWHEGAQGTEGEASPPFRPLSFLSPCEIPLLSRAEGHALERFAILFPDMERIPVPSPTVSHLNTRL